MMWQDGARREVETSRGRIHANPNEHHHGISVTGHQLISVERKIQNVAASETNQNQKIMMN